MYKKLLLFCITLLTSALVNGQVLLSETNGSNLSGTGAPPEEWNDWFNKEVEKFKKAHEGDKSATGSTMNYRIPVIFHIIHYGQNVGTFPNIDSNEVKSQIVVLNNDYAGTGLNYTNVPQPFASLIANTGISFCLARRDPTGVLLNERGIHRVNANTSGWPNPATATVNLVNYINNVVKPNTMWDPTRYLNIWVSDKSPSTSILGYATYPAGTALNGIPAGVGGLMDDGVWCYAGAVGDIGAALPPYNEGRTLTREIAHWLGVRSIWGDGNCLTDYCSDTPWGKQANTGFPPYPSYVNRCGPNQSPFGEMTMNFMDHTYDTCRYMFTPQQALRMQTAMSQGTYRNLLGTHNLCNVLAINSASATAGFYFNGPICAGQPITPINTSTGGPQPTFQWGTAPSTTISPAPSVAMPSITFPTAGTYTVYLTATNTVNIATYSLVVSTSTCPAEPMCLDTIRRIQNNDTLITYKAANSNFVQGCQTPNFAGYLTGTNCYNDKEFAQWIPASSFASLPNPQVNSVIVLFDSTGTRTTPNSSNTPIYCKLYSGNINSGPNSQFAVKMDSIGKIVKAPKVTNVKYVGDPSYIFTTTKIIPYKFDFASPIVLTTNSPGFYAAVQTPYSSQIDSIRIFGNTVTSSTNDSTSWLLQNPTNNWRTLRYARGARVQLAILPQMTCRPLVGIEEMKSEFGSNIAIAPNPNNGVFSLIFTLPRAQKLSVATYNMLGQKIADEQLENVSYNVVNMDLNGRPDGIYFIHISNGTDKLVQKVVVTH